MRKKHVAFLGRKVVELEANRVRLAAFVIANNFHTGRPDGIDRTLKVLKLDKLNWVRNLMERVVRGELSNGEIAELWG